MADVSIDASVSASTARGMRSVVFTSKTVGYWFYIDSDGTFGYSKTTDGGASWGGQVEIAAATTHTSFDVWFDQWTPGDTGAKIHTWYVDTTNDDVTWRTLDTSNDSLQTAVQVLSLTSATAARGSFCSGTKTRSGYLYVAYTIDASNEDGIQRSTDAGATWGSNLAAGFMEATIDQCLAFPASNTGDDNDAWFVYQDASTDELTMKLWDSSAAAAVESAEIGASMAEGTTDLAHQMGFSASVRHSDGKLILAVMTAYDASTDHRTYTIDANGAAAFTVTALTAIQTATDDHYHPAVFIDQATDNIYVAYNGLRDGTEVIGTTTKVYYTKSTNGGASWSAGNTAYQEGAAGVAVQVWAPLMGKRFYVGWRVGTTLLGNKVNSIAFTPLAVAQASETDLAQAISNAPQRRLLGQVAETDIAQAIARVKTAALGQAAEADLAQAVSGRKTASVAQVAEANLAQAIAWAPKHRLLERAIEANLAQAVTSAKRAALGEAAETDLGQSVTRVKAAALAQSAETDLAQTLTPVVAKIVALDRALEADAAQAVAHAKTAALMQAAETDAAQSVTTLKMRGVTLALEIDLAQALASAKGRALGEAAETDLGQSVTRVKAAALAQSAETDLAQTLTPVVAKIVALDRALEADAAQAVAHAKTAALAQAGESDAAQSVTTLKVGSVTLALEIDLAQALASAKGRALAQAGESDTAQVLGAAKRAGLGEAAETDAAQSVEALNGHGVALALEIDLSQALSVGKGLGMGAAFEIDLARPIAHFMPGPRIAEIAFALARRQTDFSLRRRGMSAALKRRAAAFTLLH